MKLAELIHRFEEKVPRSLAMDKDPIGLHFGSYDQEVKSLLVTLDIRPAVVKEAIDLGVDLIIAHHPPIFRPIKNFGDQASPQTRMYQDLIRSGIAVYAAHTNLDIVEGGVNDVLAQALGLEDLEVLSPTQSIASYKLVVFCPHEAVQAVKEAAFQAGAGQIGPFYDQCAYSSSGLGQFRSLEGANPTIGQLGQLSQVPETRLEILVAGDHVSSVLQAVREAHPYEEPAIDLIALKGMDKVRGLGRVGNLPQALTNQELINLVKRSYHLTGLRAIIGPQAQNQTISRVALCGGAGEEFYQAALAKGAQAYITGDIFFHTAHDMQETPLVVLDAGHYIEHLIKDQLMDWFQAWSKEENWDIQLHKSQVNTDPFIYY